MWCLSSKVVLIVALAALGFPSARANNSTDEDEYGNMVVGGFKVDTEAVPYQVALFKGNSLICGGTIIGPRWVLTSYHCVDSMNSSQFSVVVGTDKPREGTKIPVVDIFLHPDVERNSMYDLALLKLAKPLQFGKKVNCVQLQQSAEAIVEGKPAYISGFGSTAEFAHDSPLKAATIDLLPWEVCAKTYPHLMQHFMICAGFKGGKVDSCQGDSGGPLVMDGKLTGITFYGRGCARANSPGVYISVPDFSDLIINTVLSEENPEDRKLCKKKDESI